MDKTCDAADFNPFLAQCHISIPPENVRKP